MDAYVTYLLAAGRSQRTITLRTYHLGLLLEELDSPMRASADDLVAFMARRAHLAAETRRTFRASLRSFYRWAHESGRRGDDPSRLLPPITSHERPARVADDGDLAAAIASASPRDRAMILLARSACLRRGEIAPLSTDDREGDVLRIVGKGGRIRMVWLEEGTATALDELRASGYYFRGRDGGPMKPESVSQIIKRTTGWNAHALRHAGATAAYAATKDLRTLQRFLGHASIVTTQRYVSVPDEQIAAMAAALRLAA